MIALNPPWGLVGCRASIFAKWPKRSRRQRKPTVASVAKQASKAGLKVARYEVPPDGTVVVVTGKGEATEASNPWLDDLTKVKQ